jgi:hypothetical protein
MHLRGRLAGRITLRLVYEELQLRPPRNIAGAARAFLRKCGYCTRAVTHTASDLNEKHEELIGQFRLDLKRLIEVRMEGKSNCRVTNALTHVFSIVGAQCGAGRHHELG